MNRIDPDITWFLSMTVDQMKTVHAVVEAAEAVARTRNTTLTTENRHVLFLELCEAVEAMQATEGKK